MRSISPSLVLVALVALPIAAESRIRVENTSDGSARLTVGFADQSRNAAKLKVGGDGIAELVVEAPSPRMRLSGGTLQTDPMIDLIARRQNRLEAGAPALYVIDNADTPAQFAPFDGPLVYDDWGGMYGAGAWGGAARGRARWARTATSVAGLGSWRPVICRAAASARSRSKAGVKSCWFMRFS